MAVLHLRFLPFAQRPHRRRRALRRLALVSGQSDESKVDVYRKTAELYVILGDLDSAIALLERGITATDDGELQSYLDELIEKQSFFVLIRQDSYSPLASSTMHSAFTYDQSGFQVNWDAWSLEDPVNVPDIS